MAEVDRPAVARGGRSTIGIAADEHAHPHLRHVGPFYACTEGPCVYFSPIERANSTQPAAPRAT